jgi:hypothetical protein
MYLHAKRRVILLVLSVIDIIREDKHRPKLDSAGRQYCFSSYRFVDISGEIKKVSGNWERRACGDSQIPSLTNSECISGSFYGTMNVSVSNGSMTDGSWVENELKEKNRGLIQVLSPLLPGQAEKKHEKFKRVCRPTENRTEHISNTNPERYR